MASDDQKERPFFFPGTRRSLLATIDEKAEAEREKLRSAAEQEFANWSSSVRAEKASPEASEPMPSFIRKEQEARARAEDEAVIKDKPKQGLPSRIKHLFRKTDKINKEAERAAKPKKQRSFKVRATLFLLYWGAIAAVWFTVILIGAVTVYSLTAEDPLSAGLSKQPAKLTILASDQCPMIIKCADDISQAARALGLKPKVVRITSAKASRELPTPYGVFCIIYDGRLIAERPVSGTRFTNIVTNRGTKRGMPIDIRSAQGEKQGRAL